MKRFKVAIVGGGPGGLMTAYFLQKQADYPYDLTLYEASPRLGGKIQTQQFSAWPATYEAGAAELYDYSPVDEDPLKQLVLELGLSITGMGGMSVIMRDRILTTVEDIRDCLGGAAHREFLRFDRLAKDWITPGEFYTADQVDTVSRVTGTARFDTVVETIEEPGTRRYLEYLIHSDLATEPHKTSPAYGLQNYLMNDPAYMNLYSIEGGNERLPQELAKRIAGQVRLGQPVQSIARLPSGRLSITSAEGAVAVSEEYDFVVIAVPHNQLPSIRFEHPKLQAAMVRHAQHYDYPANYLRITILFEKPFWRERLAESYFMLDQFDGCCLYDESSRSPELGFGVLGWLLAGEAAGIRGERSDAELIDEALQSLPSFLSHGRHLFVEGRVHRWLGAVNGMPGGQPLVPLDQRHQPEPSTHPNLFVVGDYMYDSTLNGVLDSATYVANWLASIINETY